MHLKDRSRPAAHAQIDHGTEYTREFYAVLAADGSEVKRVRVHRTSTRIPITHEEWSRS